ncbi:MAG: ChaN family lipoprotein [Bdellovibrionales bacterium]|jgi:uncharacterized iron-regulated protein|nr:ChaN family lipoprotein [Bdellovibrionales bacterium]
MANSAILPKRSFGLKPFALRGALAVLTVVAAQAGGVSAHAQSSGAPKPGPTPQAFLLDGASLQTTTIQNVVSGVKAGEVLVLAEEHGNPLHYANQKAALAALAATGRCTVSVGLEFLSWTVQDATSAYFDGLISEQEFLSRANWGGNPFVDYRDQALFPKTTGGRLIGVNSTRTLSSAIAKKGVDGLSAEEQAELPPHFTVGSAHYRERFDAIMGGHGGGPAMDRYFAAQSVWDDTMAWQAKTFLDLNPTHCLAIIVGDFHAAWGGGLPDRLKARGVAVTTISQMEIRHHSQETLKEAVGPHPVYGVRGDAIWLSLTP